MHRPKHPYRLAALLTLGTACAGAVADESVPPPGPADFAYRQPLQVPEGSDGALVRFTLVPAVYRSLSRADLGDLRVFNAEGKALPYAILQPVQPEAPTRELPVHWFPWPKPQPGQDLQHLVFQLEQQGASMSLSTDVTPRAAPAGGAYLVDISSALE